MGRIDMMKLLLNHDAVVNKRDQKFGQTALMWAAPEYPVFIDGRTDVFEWTGVLRDAMCFDAAGVYFGTQSGSVFSTGRGGDWHERR